jgi:alanyl-tRNA synthetase
METLDDSRRLPAQSGETLLEVKMSETQPLFHEKPYLKQLECRVDLLEHDDAGLPFALLGETVFYPQGGGQLGDRGVLNIPGPGQDVSVRALEIASTKKRDDQIRHYLSVDDEVFRLLKEYAIGQQATATLDWPLRYHQMRLHSALHLMHCMLEQTLGRSISHPIRSPLSDECGENQYEFVEEFDEGTLRRATDALNEFCSASHEIRTEADTRKGQGFRWWLCENWSIPCGGVHVRNTQEIGLVISSMKIKKNTTRVIVTLSAEAKELG